MYLREKRPARVSYTRKLVSPYSMWMFRTKKTKQKLFRKTSIFILIFESFKNKKKIYNDRTTNSKFSTQRTNNTFHFARNRIADENFTTTKERFVSNLLKLPVHLQENTEEKKWTESLYKERTENKRKSIVLLNVVVNYVPCIYKLKKIRSNKQNKYELSFTRESTKIPENHNPALVSQKNFSQTNIITTSDNENSI